MLDEFPVLPLKLGSLFPVAGPEATYSLLLLLLEDELPGVVLPLILPGVEAVLLIILLLLPGVTPPVVVFVTEPGAELLEELLPGVVLLEVLLPLSAFPLLVMQAPFAAKL